MARVLWRTGRIGIAVIIPLMVLGLFLYALNLLVFGQSTAVTTESGQLSEWDQPIVFREDGYWHEAEQIYQVLLEENKGNGVALDASKELVLLYIESGQSQKADAQYVTLREDYVACDGHCEALVQIGDEYRSRGAHDKARLVYADILELYPNDEQTLGALAGFTISGVLSSQDEMDMTEIDAFIDSYAQDERMPQVGCQMGDTLRQMGRLEQSRPLYRYIAQQWPQSDSAFWARMGLAIADAVLGERHKAAEGFVKMLADYGNDSRMSVAGCLIADTYRKEGYFQKAGEVYQCTLDTWPEMHHALWCQMGLVLSDIALGNDANTLARVDQLVTRFPDDDRLPNAVNQIADQCRHFQKHEEATLLYRHVIQNWPSADQTVWCRMGLAILECQDNSDPNATPELNALLAAEAEDPSLPLASFLVGEQYRNQAMGYLEVRRQEEAHKAFLRAAHAWEDIIEHVPESVYTPESYYQLADCYYGLGRYGDAISLYQYIAKTWPDFELSWHCQFLVGYRCNELKKAGELASSQADPQIQEAYTRLMERYPECPAASAASDWLSRHSN